jgi:hypothetical protein
MLRRLRTHRLLKKVGHTYKYYVTPFGKEVVATAVKPRELVIIPQPENVRILLDRFYGKRQNLIG